jgi:hypothetical protein
LAHVFGEDFARSGDVTDIIPLEIGTDLVRRCPFIVELRNVPFDQQRDILYYLVDRLPRMSGGALDATGNGAYLAEKAAQRYGATIVEVKLSQSWYQVEMPAYIEAFSDKTVQLPRHDDILQDHQALAFVNGIIKVPDDHRFKGSDGFDRHGDSAIAGALAYFASRQNLPEYGYIPADELNNSTGAFDTAHDFEERWQSPMVARKSTILGPDGRSIAISDLSEEIAQPSLTGSRQTHSDREATGLTPEKLASILQRAATGDIRSYLTLAEEMEERYLHYASQLQTRRLAIESIGVSVEADKAVPTKIVDAVKTLIENDGFDDALGSLTDGIAKGVRHRRDVLGVRAEALAAGQIYLSRSALLPVRTHRAVGAAPGGRWQCRWRGIARGQIPAPHAALENGHSNQAWRGAASRVSLSDPVLRASRLGGLCRDLWHSLPGRALSFGGIGKGQAHPSSRCLDDRQ